MKNSDEFRNILKKYEEKKTEKLIEMTCRANLLKEIRKANIHGKNTAETYPGQNFYKDIYIKKDDPENKNKDPLK